MQRKLAVKRQTKMVSVNFTIIKSVVFYYAYIYVCVRIILKLLLIATARIDKLNVVSGLHFLSKKKMHFVICKSLQKMFHL